MKIKLSKPICEIEVSDSYTLEDLAKLSLILGLKIKFKIEGIEPETFNFFAQDVNSFKEEIQMCA